MPSDPASIPSDGLLSPEVGSWTEIKQDHVDGVSASTSSYMPARVIQGFVTARGSYWDLLSARYCYRILSTNIVVFLNRVDDKLAHLLGAN